MEAPVTDIHFHHAWLIWALYLFGMLLHFALQVNDIAAKNKWTRVAVIKVISIPFAFRAFFSMMIFGLVWHYPLVISNILGIFGHPLSSDESQVLAIPMNNFIAGVYGLGLDSALGYIPGLKSWLPTVGPLTTSLEVAAEANVKAGEAIAGAQVAAQKVPPEAEGK